MGDQISPATGRVQALANAYQGIGIPDTSIADGDVAVAFYTTYSDQRYVFFDTAFAINSLKVIAECRQSKLLAFVQAMVPHLTKENVSILATKKLPARITESSATARVETTSDEPGLQAHNSSNNPVHSSPESFDVGSLAKSKPLTQVSATTVHINDSVDSLASDQPENASNFSSDLSSVAFSDDDSNISETSEPAGGKVWNGEAWCCKICNEELDDEGKCEDGHTINPCRYCGKDFEPLACSKFCIECHDELPRPCSTCNMDESMGAMQMVWDDKDNVWRCTACMWEIEANSENEGHCHCIVDREDFISTAVSENPKTSAESLVLDSAATECFFRPIELLYYHEYEPADSDSSDGDSMDTEPDSGDESAIDDSESLKSSDPMMEDYAASPIEISEVIHSTRVQKNEVPAASGES